MWSFGPSVLELRQAAEAATPSAIALRREIHQRPELAGSEVLTAERIAAALEPLGLDIATGVGGHGVVATLRGGLPGPVVGFRAELSRLGLEHLPRGSTPGDESQR